MYIPEKPEDPLSNPMDIPNSIERLQKKHKATSLALSDLILRHVAEPGTSGLETLKAIEKESHNLSVLSTQLRTLHELARGFL